MDDRCWYVLRQRHYPPPTAPPRKSKGIPWKGPICLGHIIPGPKGLDQVKNRSDLLPFEADMPVYPSKTWNLTAEFDKDDKVEASGAVKAPAGGIPVDISASVAAVFRKTVENHSQFERLDTFIIQPTEGYINKTLSTPNVDKFIKRLRKKHLGLNTWTLFMISGIAIAKGASGSRKEESEVGASGKISVDAPGVAGGSVGGSGSNKTTANMSFQKASDFVWSVRLTEISKGFFSSELKDKTYIEAATYSIKDKEVEVPELANALEGRGLNSTNSEVMDVKQDDLFFVVRTDAEIDEPESDQDAPDETTMKQLDTSG